MAGDRRRPAPDLDGTGFHRDDEAFCHGRPGSDVSGGFQLQGRDCRGKAAGHPSDAGADDAAAGVNLPEGQGAIQSCPGIYSGSVRECNERGWDRNSQTPSGGGRMNCSRCGKKFAEEEAKCPHCGEPRPEGGSGVFQSSTVLISADGADRVYRSVDEVPYPLRHRLLKSTNSPNSATILIADRRGRQEIAKAMRNLPGTGQRRLMQSLLSGSAGGADNPRVSPRWKKAVLALILAFTFALIAFVFAHRW